MGYLNILFNPRKRIVNEEKGVYIVEVKDCIKVEEEKEYVKNHCWVIKVLFFTMGLVHFVPTSFFITATDYWMYKFRNVSLQSDTTQNRTSLQSHFGAATTIATCVPLVVFVIVTTTYGHYLKSKTRVYASIGLMLLCFIVSTIFIHLNTDDWQTGFFSFSIGLIALINAGRAVYRISIFEIISKFPKVSVAYFLAGEGIGGIFNSLLQIMSLTVATSTEISALIYFLSGCFVLAFSIFLFRISQNIGYYKYYAFSEKEDKKAVNFQDFIDISLLIWPNIIIILFLYVAQLTTSPAITSLVVSENFGSGKWSDVYFVPVVTFLLNNLSDFLGRTLCSKINKNMNGILITVIMVLRMVIFVPMIMLCNAQPRNHLPVLFPHDYQYIIIIIVFGFTSGYFFNSAFISIPSKVPEKIIDKAYSVLVIYVGLIGGGFSVLSFFCVDVL